MREARRFTGRHMAIILVAFFGVIFAVNFLMARLALSTFGGTVVDNSYVASQEFNGRLEQARAEQALGWTIAVTPGPDGRLVLSAADASGQPLAGGSISAGARHPLGREPERELRFHDLGDGRYRAEAALPAGRWQFLARFSHGDKSVHVMEELR